MATKSSAVAAEPQDRVLVIDRIFEAPRELVFKCFTEPERMEWMQPKGFTSRLIAYDFRPLSVSTCVGPTARIIGKGGFSARSCRRSGSCGRFAGPMQTEYRPSPRRC